MAAWWHVVPCWTLPRIQYLPMFRSLPECSHQTGEKLPLLHWSSEDLLKGFREYRYGFNWISPASRQTSPWFPSTGIPIDKSSCYVPPLAYLSNHLQFPSVKDHANWLLWWDDLVKRRPNEWTCSLMRVEGFTGLISLMPCIPWVPFVQGAVDKFLLAAFLNVF